MYVSLELPEDSSENGADVRPDKVDAEQRENSADLHTDDRLGEPADEPDGYCQNVRKHANIQ